MYNVLIPGKNLSLKVLFSAYKYNIRIISLHKLASVSTNFYRYFISMKYTKTDRLDSNL